jgi:hypothetical protein
VQAGPAIAADLPSHDPEQGDDWQGAVTVHLDMAVGGVLHSFRPLACAAALLTCAVAAVPGLAVAGCVAISGNWIAEPGPRLNLPPPGRSAVPHVRAK